MGIHIGTARKSPFYQNVVNRCTELLIEKGHFSKKEISDALALQGVDFEWGLVIRILQEDHKCELIRLAKRFFHRQIKPRADIKLHPNKFIAINHATAYGYGIADKTNAGLVICCLVQQGARIAGLEQSRRQFVTKAKQVGIEMPAQIAS
jgi:hypothetical protein